MRALNATGRVRGFLQKRQSPSYAASSSVSLWNSEKRDCWNTNGGFGFGVSFVLLTTPVCFYFPVTPLASLRVAVARLFSRYFLLINGDSRGIVCERMCGMPYRQCRQNLTWVQFYPLLRDKRGIRSGISVCVGASHGEEIGSNFKRTE